MSVVVDGKIENIVPRGDCFVFVDNRFSFQPGSFLSGILDYSRL